MCSDKVPRVPWVLQVSDLSRMPRDKALCDLGRGRPGAVVHQQQLPVGISLGDDAIDGLGQKLLAIQENRDDRYARRAGIVAFVVRWA